MGKSISHGFGIVRMLTSVSQGELLGKLDAADIPISTLKRRPPFHATVLSFIKMSHREQTAFHAGFSVARLEERLENHTQKESPRRPLEVEIGAIARIGNFLYAPIDSPELDHEQVQLAGQMALHGISPARIDRKVVPPHVGIGFVQGAPVEEIRTQVESTLAGTPAVLQRWNVYPERYA